jgi:hypothetical protein
MAVGFPTEAAAQMYMVEGDMLIEVPIERGRAGDPQTGVDRGRKFTKNLKAE